MFSLEGKNAWVTGASYGIGFNIAKAFAEAGIKNIVFNDINEELLQRGLANYKEAVLQCDNYITRYRAGLGAKFRITRNHRLDFYYYFDYDRGYNIDYKGNKGDLKGYLQENEFRHIFGISYKFKL